MTCQLIVALYLGLHGFDFCCWAQSTIVLNLIVIFMQVSFKHHNNHHKSCTKTSPPPRPLIGSYYDNKVANGHAYFQYQ